MMRSNYSFNFPLSETHFFTNIVHILLVVNGVLPEKIPMLYGSYSFEVVVMILSPSDMLIHIYELIISCYNTVNKLTNRG